MAAAAVIAIGLAAGVALSAWFSTLDNGYASGPPLTSPAGPNGPILLSAPPGLRAETGRGPNGEPCIRTLTIPGKKDTSRYVFTKTVKGVIYTTVVDGLTHYAPGTKAPPTITTERVCVYKPVKP